jgi:inhibitor of KinA
LLNDLDLDERRESRVVEIPVHYGGESGPDLDIVAKHNGLTPEEVVAIHSNGHYFVNMIGFAPGFPYIGGMSEKIATPRKSSPRLKIPAGSVGIAGKQTGIYPIETPGGWQIIGKTPLQLFRPDHDPPSLLKAGDKICFKPITLKEFREWE